MSLKISNTVMYNALVRKDNSFEGLFIAGVKTTGIFCKPTCTAKKPKKENVEFFRSTKDALSGGYRPCRICKPLEENGTAPAVIKKLLTELEENPAEKITDYKLTQKGIEPAKIRRWFMKNHGMTFHAFQRLMRINKAFGNIKSGGKVIEAAYNNGYDSLSGFNHSFKKAVRINPKESSYTDILTYERFQTPLGTMIAVASDKGIYLLEFCDRRMLETELKLLMKKFKAAILPGSNPHLKKLISQLGEYYKGKRKTFNVPLIPVGTDFQKNTWKVLMQIPYGETRSYKDQAIALGNPTAVRAVANANGMNKIAIIIPCHRVIGEDGHLTGYGGGLWRKKWLLDLERKNID
jgi:AraC family transcriptional regulator, regulatory protein of adaptative response / methylated-DNA-[protein]-cysteine methyltransferase